MREKLEDYVQRAKEVVENAPQMGEANTKNMLVRPFIETLGWEFYPSEIELEYPVQMASQQTKVDYALMLDKAPSVFVEAKGLDTQLTKKHRRQITSYMHNEKGVEWGLLTNGQQYEFYRYDQTPSGLRLGKIPLEQLSRNIEIVRTLSKESVKAGESERIAERIRARKHAVSTLKTDKDEIAEDVTDVVTDRIGDSLSTIVETEAKELVDSIVDSLKEEDSPQQTTDSSPIRNAISGKIRRSDIQGDPDSRVAIFPTQTSGIKFLKENNAWGFVRIAKVPDFVGMYVSAPDKKVKFIAEVDKIVKAKNAKLANPPEHYVDKAKFDPEKSVIIFKSNSLSELEDPIPYGEKVPYSLVYTNLRSFKDAENTDDIL